MRLTKVTYSETENRWVYSLPPENEVVAIEKLGKIEDYENRKGALCCARCMGVVQPHWKWCPECGKRLRLR